MATAVFFILFAPFAFLPYLLIAGFAGNLSFPILVAIEVSAIALIIVANGVQCSKGIFESPAYALAAPLSGAIVSVGFLSAIADAKKKDAVSWRGRQYTVSENQHPIS
jgi:hypothetical protein